MKPLDCSPHALPFTSFQEAASVLGLTTIRQVLDRPYRRDLIENLLSETGMSVLYGAGGVGKSGLLLEVAISIAAGTDTLNRRTMSGFTVFVHTEGASGLKPRLQAVSLAKGIEIEDLPLVFIEEPVNMRNTESVDNLARKIRELENRSGIKCRLLIIDTLARCFYGDENRQPEMVEFVDNMSRIVHVTYLSSQHNKIIHICVIHRLREPLCYFNNGDRWQWSALSIEDDSSSGSTQDAKIHKVFMFMSKNA